MEKNMKKNQRKENLKTKLKAMIGVAAIATTSCGHSDSVSNVGTNIENEKNNIRIEQETTEATTVDMTIEEILTTRKNNTVTTPNNDYYNDDYYDNTVYLEPEVTTSEPQVIPTLPSQPSNNKHQTAQSNIQSSTQETTEKETTEKQTKPETTKKPETKPVNKTTTNESKTTAKTEAPTSKKTTTKKPETKPTTTKKTTTTTKKTTTTTKPTTTTTTTTKKPETTTTQAPVIEEPEYTEYTLEDIRESADAFEYYTEKLCEELYNGYNLLRTFGNSSGYNECKVALALLNYDQGISNDVLSTVFADYTTDEIYEYAYCMDIARINCDFAEESVDFNNYLLDKNLADEINMMNEYYIQASYGDSENFVNQLYAYASNITDYNYIENYPLFWYYCCSGDNAAFRFGLDTECITQEEEILYKNRIDEYCSEFKGYAKIR